MFKKILVLAVAVCLIQCIEGDSIADLIKELKPKLEAAASQVAKATIDGGEKVKAGFLSIQESLNVLDKQLIQQRVELFKSVQKAKEDAKASGKNIDACLKQVREAAKNLTGWQFEKCRLSPELNRVALDLTKLSKQEAILIAAPVKCTVQSLGDLAKLKACILQVIDNAQKQAADVASTVDPRVEKGVKDSETCGASEATKLDVAIKKASDDFSGCVSKA